MTELLCQKRTSASKQWTETYSSVPYNPRAARFIRKKREGENWFWIVFCSVSYVCNSFYGDSLFYWFSAPVSRFLWLVCHCIYSPVFVTVFVRSHHYIVVVLVYISRNLRSVILRLIHLSLFVPLQSFWNDNFFLCWFDSWHSVLLSVVHVKIVWCV